MRSLAKRVAWLLPLLLSGCAVFHKTRPAPILRLAPTVESSSPLELISAELPPNQSVIAARPIYNMREEAVPIRQPVRHHRPKPPEETNLLPSPSPIPVPAVTGVLTSTDPSNSRQQAEGSIAEVERGLSGINRSLDDSQQKTAGQIREFLKQAKAALDSGDADGAHTLTEKARVLLAELAK